MSSIDIVLAVLSAAGGSAVIVAGLAAWLGKVWADRIAQAQKFNHDIDINLREKRIAVYAELWTATAILPKWPQSDAVTYERLHAFSCELRDWYFLKGGMYLSRSTHSNAYSPLQDALADVLRAKKSGPISAADYESVRQRCSALRTALAGDIESRRESSDD